MSDATLRQELSMIADAINSLEDGMSISDGPKHIEQYLKRRGCSPEIVDLGEAIVRLSARLHGG